jgi:hypothetical protein
MTHHYSGPNLGFPRGDARVNLTDLFAFPKRGDPSKFDCDYEHASLIWTKTTGTDNYGTLRARGPL